MAGLAYFGNALSHIGGDVSEFGDKQEKLRQQLELMAQARAEKLRADNMATEELALRKRADDRAQAEADRATKAEKDQSDFQGDIVAGKSAAAPDGTEIDPSSPDSQRPANVQLSKDEIIQKALQKGVLSPEKYLEYTKSKEITPTADIQDYMAAKSQGYNGSFVDFLKTKASATHIDVGGAATTRAKQAEITSLRSGNATQTKDYDVAKRAALAFNQDYQRYQAIKASGDPSAIKIAQQGMTDKYITSSTGKSTGDAQFNNFRESQGLTNTVKNLYAKVMDGSMAPDEAFQEMRRITMGTAEALRQKTKQANDATRTNAAAALPRLGYIDPAEAIVHPDDMLHQDSAAYAIPHPQDSEAVIWAKANPKDPRSAAILKANGQ